MTISDHQTFLDYWQVVGERYVTDGVLMDAGITVAEALRGITSKPDIRIHTNIHPLEVNKYAEKKIIESQGGITSIKEFMAYNAEWDRYKNELEARNK